jgi:serine/threonine-protein kinase RsbW
MALSDQMPPSTGSAPAAGTEPTGTADDDVEKGDIIELIVPALSTYLSVVRTATAGLAARLSFTFDEIEDLRIAVDEACAMLLSLPGPGDPTTLTCRFRVLPEALAVTVSAAVDEKAVMPMEQSFAWQVLTAHAAEVNGSADHGIASVELLKRRRPAR